MYAAIRRYQIDPERNSAVVEHILENFVPLIRQTPGLFSYHVLDGGSGAFATLTVCKNQSAIESTNTLAAEWIRQYLASRIMSEQGGTPNLSVGGEEIFQGDLYEGVSEPTYKRSLQLLSVPEVGELLGMGRSWVYQQIKSGDMPSVHLGGSVKVKREDLEEYIQKRRHYSPPSRGAEE
jgi:excisionase family DNA binding protein